MPGENPQGLICGIPNTLVSLVARSCFGLLHFLTYFQDECLYVYSRPFSLISVSKSACHGWKFTPFVPVSEFSVGFETHSIGGEGSIMTTYYH